MRRRRPLKWHGKNRTLRAFVTARTRPIGPAERAKERENRSPDRGVRLEAGRGEAWRVEVRHGSRPHGDASSVRRRRRQARARRTPSGPGAGQHRASDDERRSRGARGAADIWQSHHAREPHHTQARSPPCGSRSASGTRARRSLAQRCCRLPVGAAGARSGRHASASPEAHGVLAFGVKRQRGRLQTFEQREHGSPPRPPGIADVGSLGPGAAGSRGARGDRCSSDRARNPTR
jgi:hypothetical protein